jgi:lipopolysaccharide export system protein LptA
MTGNKSRPVSRSTGGRSFVVLAVTALAVSADPVWAQNQPPGGGLAASYSANANKPVDIESDSLEVDDKKKIATFKGNVLATQGDFNLRAKEIQVTYTDSKKNGTKKDATKTASNAPASPLPGDGTGDIQQIDAKGKVLMNTKDGQTATSDWAVFEVKKQLITIGGDVVLTQGTSTIKGSKMVIDLTSGLTRLETGDDKTVGIPTGRIKAIFTPKDRPGKSKDKPGETPAEKPAN